jgi:type II secretion system protein D
MKTADSQSSKRQNIGKKNMAHHFFDPHDFRFPRTSHRAFLAIMLLFGGLAETPRLTAQGPPPSIGNSGSGLAPSQEASEAYYTLRFAPPEEIRPLLREKLGTFATQVTIDIDPSTRQLVVVGPPGALEMADRIVPELEVEWLRRQREPATGTPPTLSGGFADMRDPSSEMPPSEPGQDATPRLHQYDPALASLLEQRLQARFGEDRQVSLEFMRTPGKVLVFAPPTKQQMVAEVIAQLDAAPVTDNATMGFREPDRSVEMTSGASEIRFGEKESSRQDSLPDLVGQADSSGLIRTRYRPKHASLGHIQETMTALLADKLQPQFASPQASADAMFGLNLKKDGQPLVGEIAFLSSDQEISISGDARLCNQLLYLIRAIDQRPEDSDRRKRFITLRHSDPKQVRKIIDALEEKEDSEEPENPQSSRGTPSNQAIRMVNYLFQDGGAAGGGGAAAGGAGAGAGVGNGGLVDDSALEVVPQMSVQPLPDLDVLVVDAPKSEFQRIVDLVEELERLSERAQPNVEIYQLDHVYCVSLKSVIDEIYMNSSMFATKQGRVSYMPLIKPNAMLLLGWGEAMNAMQELIGQLDQPIASENNILEVITLRHASAQYLAQVIQQNFPLPTSPQGSAFAPRVRVSPDMRTNSLIVQAAPNDLADIQKLVRNLDVEESGSSLQIQTFKLKNSLADDMVAVLEEALQPAVNGTSDQKYPNLEFLIQDAEARRVVESGIMADVSITADIRNNTLIVTAPANCMPLITQLIEMLDQPSSTAQIKVFPIIYGDAQSLITMLQTLIPNQVQSGVQLPASSDETSLVPVRFAVDVRTNSIIAAGSEGDLKIIESLILTLDREDTQRREQTVYRLKNSPAVDVAIAVDEYLSTKRQLQAAAPGVVSPYQQIEREVIVIPENVTNSLIISATPRYYEETLKLIEDLDRQPAQVVIQVLIAEVTLNNTDEFGVELGFQDSILYDRSVVENQVNKPGFLFAEQTGNSSLGNSSSTESEATRDLIGSQVLSTLGTGRINTDAGFGGLVMSASSDSVSIMLRALQESSRLEILSRPQIMALDNQMAMILVGQRVPRVSGTNISSGGRQQNNITLENVGLILGVTPRISPEGKVVMDIAAEKSSLAPISEGIPVSISEGEVVRSPSINSIQAQTVVSASDGETVVLGGLITKETQDLNRRVPIIADIPILGQLFQYNFEECRRSELLIIMTPRIIEEGEDMEKIKEVEAARMNWCLSDVKKLHGEIGVWDVRTQIPMKDGVKTIRPEYVDPRQLGELSIPSEFGNEQIPPPPPTETVPTPGGTPMD